jgi:hypothetical protein
MGKSYHISSKHYLELQYLIKNCIKKRKKAMSGIDKPGSVNTGTKVSDANDAEAQHKGQEVRTETTAQPRTGTSAAEAVSPSLRATSGGRIGAGKSLCRLDNTETLTNIKASEPSALYKIAEIAFESELDALQGLREACLHDTNGLTFPEGKNAAWLYDFQMGRIDNEGNPIDNPDQVEIIRIVKMYNMLPSELLARSTLDEDQPDFINMKWLNQAFIDAYNEIEAIDPARDGDLQLRDGGLIAVPANIGKLTALVGLDLSNNNLSTLPPELGQLKALVLLITTSQPCPSLRWDSSQLWYSLIFPITTSQPCPLRWDSSQL